MSKLKQKDVEKLTLNALFVKTAATSFILATSVTLSTNSIANQNVVEADQKSTIVQFNNTLQDSIPSNVQMARAITNSRILLEKLMMNYHLSTAQQANPKYQKKVRLAVKQIEAELEKIQESASFAKLTSESRQIPNNWTEFKSILTKNLTELEKRGYAELQVVDTMVARARLFDNTLQIAYNQAKSKASDGVNGNAEAARALSRLLQHIANKYAERAASATGTAFRSQFGEVAIDQLAKQFSQQLKRLQTNTANNDDINHKLHQVELKWKYIEKSLENYTQDSISFLVTHYSHDMVEQLLGVASIYEQS